MSELGKALFDLRGKLNKLCRSLEDAGINVVINLDSVVTEDLNLTSYQEAELEATLLAQEQVVDEFQAHLDDLFE